MTGTRKLKAVIAALVVAALAMCAGVVKLAPAAGWNAQGQSGLAQTPPMGWNSWNEVGCDVDAEVVKNAADQIVASGLDKVGYDYVVLDDCWQGGRDSSGALYPDEERFPDGIKALADYVHRKGLKFGIYAVPGTQTCGNQFFGSTVAGIGSLGHEQQDADTFASWGVDYLKYDWCSAGDNDGLAEKPAFGKMSNALKATGRPIVYSISEYGMEEAWKWADGFANAWRTTFDIEPTWDSISGIIDDQAALSPYAAPGHWNDPDMLQVGNGSLTAQETKTHIAMWSMLAAPLFVGTDIDKLDSTTLALLRNSRMTAIDQDSLGQQAHRVTNDDGLQVWARKLANGDTAVALYNASDSAATIDTTLDAVGADTSGSSAVTMTEVWSGKSKGITTGAISSKVPAHGVTMLRLHSGG